MDSEMAQRPLADHDFWTQGLDRAFFSRVYVRATQLGIAAAVLFLAFDQRLVSVGLFSGLVIGLFSLWSVEATVRLLFNGGRNAGLKLAIGAVVKLPFVMAGMITIAWASYNKYMNVFGVVGGVILVHMTILVTIVATAIAYQDRNRERYR